MWPAIIAAAATAAQMVQANKDKKETKKQNAKDKKMQYLRDMVSMAGGQGMAPLQQETPVPADQSAGIIGKGLGSVGGYLAEQEQTNIAAQAAQTAHDRATAANIERDRLNNQAQLDQTRVYGDYRVRAAKNSGAGSDSGFVDVGDPMWRLKKYE